MTGSESKISRTRLSAGLESFWVDWTDCGPLDSRVGLADLSWPGILATSFPVNKSLAQCLDGVRCDTSDGHIETSSLSLT